MRWIVLLIALVLLAGCSAPIPSGNGDNGDGSGDGTDNGTGDDGANGTGDDGADDGTGDNTGNDGGAGSGSVLDVLPDGIDSSTALAQQVPDDALVWGVIVDGTTGVTALEASLYVYVPPRGGASTLQDQTPLGQVEANASGLFAIDVEGDDPVLIIRAESGEAESGEVTINRALGFYGVCLALFEEPPTELAVQSEQASPGPLGLSVYPNPLMAEITDYVKQIIVPELASVGVFPTFSVYSSVKLGHADARGFFFPASIGTGFITVQYGSWESDPVGVHVLALGTLGSAQGDVVTAEDELVGNAIVTAELTGATTIDQSVHSWATITNARGEYVFNRLPPGVIYFRAISPDGIPSTTEQATVTAARDVLVAKLEIGERPVEPLLNISKSSLYFAAEENEEMFEITNLGEGTLEWEVRTGASWISVFPTDGVGDGTVTVAVDRSGLSTGTQPGVVTVVTNGGNKDISISVVVPDTGTVVLDPSLSVSPASLDFTATEDRKTLTITNGGGGTLTWAASANVDWVTIWPDSASGDGAPTVTIDTSALTEGYQTATILITSNGGDREIGLRAEVPPADIDVIVSQRAH